MPDVLDVGIGQRSEIILLIDDSLEMRYSMRRAFERQGYEVWEASTGARGLELVHLAPDIVVLDVRLPDMDGFEVCRRIRNDAGVASVPIVQYSQTAHDVASRTRGMDMGADAYLTDPEAGLLLATVGSILRQRGAEADMRLLATIGSAIDAPVTVIDRLRAAMDVLVPARAPWCVITVVGHDGIVSHSVGCAASGPSQSVDLLSQGVRIGSLVLGTSNVASGVARRGVVGWLDAVAERVAVSVANAVLLDRARNEAVCQRHLQEFVTALSTSASPREVALTIALRGADAVGATFANVALKTRSGQLALFHGPALAPEIHEQWLVVEDNDHLPLADAYRTGIPVLLGSLDDVRRSYPQLIDVTVEAGVSASASFPLSTASGAFSGAIGFAWGQATAFHSEIVATLRTVAAMASQALERSVVLERETDRRKQLVIVDAVLRAASIAVSVEQVAQAFVKELHGLPGVRRVELATVVERQLQIVASDFRPVDMVIEPGDVLDTAFRELRPAKHENSSDGVVFAVPLIVDGEGIGALGIATAVVDEEIHAVLLNLLGPLASQAVQRAMLYDSARNVAETLQRSLLPRSLPELPDFELGGAYRPASRSESVGGDWYDVIVLDDHRVALVIGDVAGHGVVAAARMARLRHTLRAFAGDTHTPRSLIDRVDAAVTSERIEMVTVLYLIIDTTDGAVSWSSAGHPPAVIVRADGSTELLVGGLRPPLGIGAKPQQSWTEGSASLSKGDTIVLYTDGLIERRAETMDSGFGRLRKTISRTTLRLDALLDDLVEPLVGNVGLDDIAVLAARLRSPRP